MMSFAIVSCSSKPKDGAGVSGDDGADDRNVSDKTLTFNPEGSDSGALGIKTVHFDYDKATLTDQARTQLKANAEWIKARPEANIQIEGHCDERGSIEYNLSLGERRAQTVKKFLVGLGIPSNRLSVISYGKEKLLDAGDSEQAHAKNRRANFLPIPK